MEKKLRVSRVGRVPIQIPDGVKTEINDRFIKVSGKLGELSLTHHENVSVEVKDNQFLVSVEGDDRKVRALHGLTRALINNMVVGVTTGYEKRLTLIGVGYRASLKGNQLQLEVGKSHDVLLDIPEKVEVEVSKKQDEIVLKGIDKATVGQFAATIIKERPVEPYKGKGIRYTGQIVRLKAGKKAGKK